MNKSVVYVLLGVLSFILAGLVGFNLGEGASPVIQKTLSTAPVHVSSSIETSAADKDENDTEEAYRQTQGPDALEFETWRIEENAEKPTACFVFAENFDSASRLKLADYYETQPETALTLSIANRELCLSGFDYNTDVDVTWKEGLTAANGQSLARNFTRNISFGDKPAFVGFAGSGVILPRINAQGLAIETINVDELSVEIARVSDRMIARRSVDDGKQTLEGDYSWEYEDAATNVRSIVWSGTLPIKAERNARVTTVLPLNDLVGTLKPGAYIVTAERVHDEQERRPARAWRWIISTDIALSSYRSAEALHVGVRSIDTARLLPSTKLVLVAANNEILAEQLSDENGRALFDDAVMRGKGPLRPKMVMAYGYEGDYAALDLSRSPIDVSGFNVAGRGVSGPVDVFSYTERGVYRPGETVHFTALLRSPEGDAIEDRAITLEVRRPNGLVMAETRMAARDIAATSGAVQFDYLLPSSAARGMWNLIIKADGLGVINRQEFSVQDFVPQRLKVEIDAKDKLMTGEDIREVVIDAQFLYGAPGAALDGEAEARVRIDPIPFPDFNDYSFGLSEESFREKLIDLGGGTTDAQGLLPLALDLKNNPVLSSHPLRAEITAGVSEPGGRYTKNSVRLPIRTQDKYIGFKSASGQNRVSKGKAMNISLIALTRDAIRAHANLSWELIEEDWDYQWYREGSRWRYRRDVIDTVMKRGTLVVSEDQPANWRDTLSWGSYRLQVTDENGNKASYRFSVGWGTSETSDRPDQIQIGGPSEPIKAGDSFTLDVNAPYAGQAELVIANDKLRVVKSLTLAEGGSQLTLPFDPSWGDSVYALLTLYTPRDVDARPVPRRAVGISYIERDRSDRILNVSIDAKTLIRPRQNYTVSVKVDNIPRGEQAYLTLAAVDEGILRLTKYNSPDAAKTLFGKKALAVDIFDDYARLLNANLGAPAIANSGGDSLGGEGLTVVPTRTVALFSGHVEVSRGKANVSFEVPPFNGELRLMATAWSKTAVGSASQSMTVRDKVPSLIGLPRFLAPGDVAQATISLDNVDGAAGTYAASLSSTGVIESGQSFQTNLDQGERQEGILELAAGETGIDGIFLQVSGPRNYKTQTDYPIEVRSPFRPITQQKWITLEAGESFSLNSSDIPFDAVKQSVDVNLAFSTMAGMTPLPYVKALSDYPYGCTEQTVATALPLLYADKLGGIKAAPRHEIQKAINRLINRQDAQGAFGLWSEGDGQARAWVGVQTTFFLQEAIGRDYVVPPDSLKKSLRAIKEISRMPRYANVNYRFSPNFYEDTENERTSERAESAAFAHYVLARAGQGDLSAMRYHYDHHSASMKTPLAHAYLAGALDLMGDKRRAKLAFETGLKAAGYSNRRDYYQSPLRDIAGLFALAAETGQSEIKEKALPLFASNLDGDQNLNTQELGYVILAFKAFAETAKSISVTANNAQLTPVNTSHFNGEDLANTPSFTNQGEGTVYASVIYSGAPKTSPAPMASGFKLDKTIFSMSGKVIDANMLKQGERAIIRVGFNSTERNSRMAVIADLLPAGLEIETVLGPKDGEAQNRRQEDGSYPWLGKLSSFTLKEARDDRFVASRETYRTDRYTAAYIVRAVTPGRFVFPGAVVEDMYRPEDRALTETKHLTISADAAL